MKKFLTTILLCAYITTLVGCATPKNVNNTSEQKINKSTLNTSSFKENIAIDLSNENKTILAKNDKDILEALQTAILSKANTINFDISDYNSPNKTNASIYKDANVTINNIWYSSPHENSELNVVEHIESTLNKETNLVSSRIYYFYFNDNTDIFMAPGIDEIAAILNKRILKKGEKSKIDLAGKNSEKYTLKYTSKSDTINISNNGEVNTLKSGEATINIKIISKENTETIYSGILKVKILPENTIKVSTTKELMNVLSEKADTDSINIYIENLNPAIIYESLISITSPYIYFVPNNEYTLIDVRYEEDKETALNNQSAINKKADEIINKIITPNMSDEEKLKTIYDYIIDNADYDYDWYSKHKVDFSSRTAYGILINGKGICGGFSDSINTLLRKTGIDSYSISGQSNIENHMWNVIKLNGEYCYLDVTWDNTLSNNKENSYKYFKVTEAEMSKEHQWNKERLNEFLKSLE